MVCGKCGTEVPNDVKFCHKCGAPLKPQNKQQSHVFAYQCPICKTPNPKDVQYCVKCGKWLLDSHFESIPLSEMQYYQLINGNKADRSATKGKIIVLSIVYGFLILFFLFTPLWNKILLSLVLMIFGIINICIPLKGLLIKKRYIGIIITLVSFFLFVGLVEMFSSDLSQATSSFNSNTTSSSEVSINSSKANAIINSKSSSNKQKSKKFKYRKISYSDLAHYTGKYINDRIEIKGQIVQSIDNGDSYTLRVNMTKDSSGMYKDTVWIDYTRKKNDPYYVENDIIHIWGVVKGRKSYTSVLGSSVTLPEINAVKITEIKEAK